MLASTLRAAIWIFCLSSRISNARPRTSVWASHSCGVHGLCGAVSMLSEQGVGHCQLREDVTLSDAEIFATEVYDDVVVSEVIRPAAVVPEASARTILVELALDDVQMGGVWLCSPSRWARYNRPWKGPGEPEGAQLVGTIEVAYGTPSKYDITIYRVTVTRHGEDQGWTVDGLCDDALHHGGLQLSTCPRADLTAPPQPFVF